MTGMVLSAVPFGDYDKRVVLLTKERGKITAFARGARRPGNSLMAASGLFATGTFSLYEGRDAYTLVSAAISNYFREIAADMETACYGSYFLEFADYYGREGVEASGMLKLLYQSLRALLKPGLPNRLVQRVFELKAMVIGGEYTEKPPAEVSEAAAYAWEYVVWSPMERLYTFTLTDSVMEEFARCVEMDLRRYVDREFQSIKILETLRGM